MKFSIYLNRRVFVKTEYPQHINQRMTKPTIRLVRPAKTQISSDPKRDTREPLPYCLDVQADLRLCWSHRSYCRFCRKLAHSFVAKLGNQLLCTLLSWAFSPYYIGNYKILIIKLINLFMPSGLIIIIITIFNRYSCI